MMIFRYKNRFILTSAGSIRSRVQEMDGRSRAAFGNPQTLLNQRWQQQLLSNELYAYDSKSNTFQKIQTLLPVDLANPGLIVTGDEFYMFSGESARHCWDDKLIGIHFDDVLVGKLEAWEIPVNQ
eukprot:TRINITY_DN4209_c0_g1_i1.p1 TRINITY_DN4209_c0_g1~~TRINITY_DN4209_c0_g1_i1.p1  ORF type:complete len:125 (+),score=23.58 TRINITY_DN4209_c0_g1_i1:67-441(+)